MHKYLTELLFRINLGLGFKKMMENSIRSLCAKCFRIMHYKHLFLLTVENAWKKDGV